MGKDWLIAYHCLFWTIEETTGTQNSVPQKQAIDLSVEKM
jgi:hypothetical protein